MSQVSTILRERGHVHFAAGIDGAPAWRCRTAFECQRETVVRAKWRSQRQRHGVRLLGHAP